MDRGEAGLAAGYVLRGLTAAQKISRPETLYGLHYSCGKAYQAAEDFPRALEQFRASVNLVESMRQNLRETRHREGFLGRKLSVYESMLEALWSLEPREAGAVSESFNTAEHMKARAFMDKLREARTASDEIPVKLLERKRLLEGRLSWLRETLDSADERP